MKKYSILFLFLSSLFTLSSCLTSGLEDLPEFEDAEITGIQRVEYRFISDEISNASGQNIVKKVELNRSDVNVNKETATATVNVTVPAANESSFPASEREKCSTKEICVMISISTAARVTRVGDAPALGEPGDWSKPNKYIVTAADGTKKEWTISITDFKK